VPPLHRLLLALALFAFSLTGFGSPSLQHARQAREMIGRELWSRIIRIQNTNARSVYPAEVYALVFELGGLLWFYTDADGTQSFSLHLNNLAAEKNDFAPLLHDIDPGFARFTVVPDAEPGVEDPRVGEPLPCGCFIESYAALRTQALRGELILRARLLSYYVTRGGKPLGHTVLAYQTPHCALVLDPLEPGTPFSVKPNTAGDPVALAHHLRPDLQITRARWAPTATGIEETLLALAGGGGSRHEHARSAPAP
jgi:hypothetical protein